MHFGASWRDVGSRLYSSQADSTRIRFGWRVEQCGDGIAGIEAALEPSIPDSELHEIAAGHGSDINFLLSGARRGGLQFTRRNCETSTSARDTVLFGCPTVSGERHRSRVSGCRVFVATSGSTEVVSCLAEAMDADLLSHVQPTDRFPRRT